MGTYRKKPVEIEARQFDGTPASATEFIGWMLEHGVTSSYRCGEKHCDGVLGLDIRTLEGTMRADPGDWVICGVKGEFYPCKPDIFQATYESVEFDPASTGGF